MLKLPVAGWTPMTPHELQVLHSVEMTAELTLLFHVATYFQADDSSLNEFRMAAPSHGHQQNFYHKTAKMRQCGLLAGPVSTTAQETGLPALASPASLSHNTATRGKGNQPAQEASSPGFGMRKISADSSLRVARR